MNDRFKYVLLTVAGIGVVTCFLLGLTTALRAGGQVVISGALHTWLVILATVASSAIVLLLTAGAVAVIADRANKRIEDPEKPYVPFLGVGTGVLVGLVSNAYADDPLLSLTIGSGAALAAAIAAKLIQTRTKLGVILFFAVPLGALVLAVATGRFNLVQWAKSSDVEDWLLVGTLGVITIGVPAAVSYVEKRRRPKGLASRKAT